MADDLLTEAIIGAALEVHKALGPGLLESTYEMCLAHELNLRRLTVIRQKSLPVHYKGLVLEDSYRPDLIVAEQVIVEIKSAASLLPVHQAQLLTYLKLTRLRVGLLINFNVAVLKTGIKRMVNG
ncbi:MAG: GxxExxY protein [Anaerolineales bacterium]|nr:GxxExxY protein [Anaerolineales bacterium]